MMSRLGAFQDTAAPPPVSREKSPARRRGLIAVVLVVVYGALVAMSIRTSGGPFAPASFPSAWSPAEDASNPLVDVDDNPAETTEQYVPASIRLPNGEIWTYVKGNSRIYAWMTTDPAVPPSLQNGGAAVLAPIAATWEGSFVLEAHAIYDEAHDTIHVWYKARDANPNNWAWGHATAPGSDPTDFTRDAANPILTSNQVEADLGATAVTDLAISSVIQVGSVFHFYGYALIDARYKLIHATGTTWNDPSGVEALLAASADSRVVETPSVIRLLHSALPRYVMFYTEGVIGLVGSRSIYQATSDDAETWDFSDLAAVIAPTAGFDSQQAYSGQFLRENQYPWSLPYVDSSGRWLYYYSGYDGAEADSGLMYLEP